jgi:putative heme-binding domain-containing protein
MRAQAEKLFGAANASSRQAVIDNYSETLSQAGDASRGRELFARHCAACHRLEDSGNPVGPDLATLTNRSPEALLVAILDPNRAVEDKFLAYTAVARDGRVTSGMLVGEAGGAITLQTADAKSVELLRKDLDEIASTEKSFMPEGLEQDLPPAALADVIAYVRSVGAPPKQIEGNKPALVAAGDDGVVHLTATEASIYGSSVIFEPRYKNLGYWSSEDDQAVWTFTIDKPARYRVAIDYACHNDTAGDALALEVGEQRLGMKVEGTGTWDDYRWQEVGEIELAQGEHELVVRSSGPIRRALIDLREVRLSPVK